VWDARIEALDAIEKAQGLPGEAAGPDNHSQPSDLERVMGEAATFDQLVQENKAKFEGNRKPFDVLRSALVRFSPDFELLPGTKPAKASTTPAKKDPFEIDPREPMMIAPIVPKCERAKSCSIQRVGDKIHALSLIGHRQHWALCAVGRLASSRTPQR
jgi:hypothetical protein